MKTRTVFVDQPTPELIQRISVPASQWHRVVLQHDHGRVALLLCAPNRRAAEALACQLEKAPPRAII